MYICGYLIGIIVLRLGAHFVLALCVGLLVYYLTLTMLCRIGFSHYQKVGVFTTQQFSLCVALCCSVLSHIVEDYTLSIV
jgi:uncharacterized metal-binding protein